MPKMPACLVALFMMGTVNDMVSRALIEYCVPEGATNKKWVQGHQIALLRYTDKDGRLCHAFMPKLAYCMTPS